MTVLHRNIAMARLARLAGNGVNAMSYIAPGWAGHLAFRLFCTPRRPPLRARDRDFLQSAGSGFFETEGHRIKFYEWKPVETGLSTPSVLLLHGWESSSARWQPYLPGLLELGYRVLALDAPAHGASDGRELNLPLYGKVVSAYTRRFGAPDAMIGHSLGAAAVVVSMALYDAPRVKKAVVLGSFAESDRVIRDFFRLLGLSRRVQNAVREEIYRRSGRHIEQYSVLKCASDLRSVEGLVIHDRFDNVSPVAEGAAIAASWGAGFRETEGFGHRLQDTSVVKEVLRFLRPA